MLIKVFGKILSSVLVIIAYVSLFSSTIALFSFGLADILSFPFSGIHEFMEFQYWEVPFWLASIPILFLVGIPFAFIAILGQRLLGYKQKNNQTVILVLIGLWVISILATITFGMSFVSTIF